MIGAVSNGPHGVLSSRSQNRTRSGVAGGRTSCIGTSGTRKFHEQLGQETVCPFDTAGIVYINLQFGQVACMTASKKKSADPDTAQETPTKARKRTMQGRHPLRVRPSTASFGYKGLQPRLVVSLEAELDSRESFKMLPQPIFLARIGFEIALQVNE